MKIRLIVRRALFLILTAVICSGSALIGKGYCVYREAVGSVSLETKVAELRELRRMQEELTAKAHNYELEKCGSTVLCLDYRHNGIGSESCGPVLQKKYKLIDETIDFAIRIIPEMK